MKSFHKIPFFQQKRFSLDDAAPGQTLGNSLRVDDGLLLKVALGDPVLRDVISVDGMNNFFDQAESGDEGAVAAITTRLLDWLERWGAIARKFPNPVRRVLQDESALPWLWNPTPKNQQAAKELWKVLWVSKENALLWDQYRRWDYRDPATQIACRLIDHLCDCGDNVRSVKEVLKVAKLSVPQSDFKWPKWYVATETLEPFSSDSWETQWWKLAKLALLDAYPAPESCPQLSSIIEAKPRRKPSRTRAVILNKLRSRFESLAKGV